MRLTRGYLLLAFGLLAGASGLTVIFAPDILPPEVEQFREVLDAQLVSQFAIGLSVFVVLVAIFRVLRPSSERVNRSLIVQKPPENARVNESVDTDRQAQLSYQRALKQFESPDHGSRLIAIYGRRAQSATEVNEDIDQYLQGLAEVVAKTYATSVGCDETTADRAVETGQWTDDRIAAAFLATDLDSDVSFTTWERFNAWLAPERVFRSRIRRVLDEAEVYAGTYLTYRRVVGGTLQTPKMNGPEESPKRTEHGGTGSRETPNARVDGRKPTGRQHRRTETVGQNDK